jgi:hypothetical protein
LFKHFSFFVSSGIIAGLTLAVPKMRKTAAMRFKLKITISPIRITITTETIRPVD